MASVVKSTAVKRPRRFSFYLVEFYLMLSGNNGSSTVKCHPIRIGHIFPYELRAEAICFTYVFYESNVYFLSRLFKQLKATVFFFILSLVSI